QADARCLLLLNDDTMVKEAAFNKMIDFLDAHPEAGACGPKLLNTDGTVQPQGGVLGKRFWLSQIPIPVDFVIGAALMVKRVVIQKVGLMDENLFFYNDDLDWCMSIRKAGWKIYFLPQAEIVHYGGYSSRRQFNPRLFVEGFKGGLYFCRKHYGETVYHIYRLVLCLCLLLCLPFQILNPNKLLAYLSVIAIAWHGQIPRPMIKLKT
ncbi:MAG: glycosyltransferase family 2 protein, partial [Candidatus Margulisbacteria bacterium]|nr:glycosyltransferase family 2 protein [Candidatus Margulisiibacteriota bacterium]